MAYAGSLDFIFTGAAECCPFWEEHRARRNAVYEHTKIRKRACAECEGQMRTKRAYAVTEKDADHETISSRCSSPNNSGSESTLGRHMSDSQLTEQTTFDLEIEVLGSDSDFEDDMCTVGGEVTMTDSIVGGEMPHGGRMFASPLMHDEQRDAAEVEMSNVDSTSGVIATDCGDSSVLQSQSEGGFESQDSCNASEDAVSCDSFERMSCDSAKCTEDSSDDSFAERTRTNAVAENMFQRKRNDAVVARIENLEGDFEVATSRCFCKCCCGLCALSLKGVICAALAVACLTTFQLGIAYLSIFKNERYVS